MKRKAFILMAGAALLAACQSASKQATINGTLTGLENDTLIATSYTIDRQRQPQTDTIVLQEGKFTLSVPCDSMPVGVYLLPQTEDPRLSGLTGDIRLVLFPGETVELTGSLNDYQVSGSDFLKTYLEAQKAWDEPRQALNNLMLEARKMALAGVPRDSISRFFAPAEDYFQQMTEAQTKYVREHLDSDVALYILSELGIMNMYDLLPQMAESVKTGPMAPLYKVIDQAVQQEKARLEAKKKVSEGAVAPDFTLKDINGNDLTLSSLRGKYVVLDFWGSWCGWCIKGIPGMKRYYDKYKDKMEILGIDCRDTEEKWKAAVKEHKMPWLHVRNVEGEGDVSVLYAIEGYPTKIVIDPEGKIAKVVVGEGPDFYNYLDELFK